IVAGTFERPMAEADAVPDQIAAYMASLSPLTHGLNSSASWDPRIVAAYLRANYLEGVRHDFYGAYVTARDVALIAPDHAFAHTMYGFIAAGAVKTRAEVGSGLPAEHKLAMFMEVRQAANRAIGLDP